MARDHYKGTPKTRNVVVDKDNNLVIHRPHLGDLPIDVSASVDQATFSGTLDMSSEGIVDVGTLSFSSGASFTSAGDNITITTVSGAVYSLETGVNINKYLTTGRTLRQAIDAAHSALAVSDGGILYWPARATSYDIDNTGLGPIEWTEDGIWWVGDSQIGSHIRNISTDSTALLEFDNVTRSVQRCGWRNLKIESASTAGDIWTFAENGLSYSRWENLWVIQDNPAKSIFRGVFTDTGGMLENQWVGGVYECATDATVPAFDLRANHNLVSLCKWEDLRFHCRSNNTFFFRLESTGDPTGPGHLHQNEWRGINVEVCGAGFAYIAGCADFTFSDITFYDTGTDGNTQTDHYIVEETGSGGKICEGTVYHNIICSNTNSLKGVAGTTVTVQSIVRSGSTATVTASGHGQSTGMVVYQEGADQEEYNGRFTVTVTDTDIYTTTVAGTPLRPPLGPSPQRLGFRQLGWGRRVSVRYLQVVVEQAILHPSILT